MVGRTINKRSGFTIVELLIVIVVIGILAAIVIVAYNGVQQRASNTQRTTAAKDWQKLLTAYQAQYGVYPTALTGNHSCLGTGFPTDLDVNPDEDCFGTGNVKHPSASANNSLKSIYNTLPSFPMKKLESVSTGTVAGISVRSYDTLDPGTPTARLLYPMMYYWLEGNDQDCGLRPVARPISGGFTTATLPYSNNDGALTRCIILLPF